MRLAIFALLALSAFGATNRTVTVKSTGGDYTSLAAAITAEKGDLVSLDRQLTIECYAMSDTAVVSIADADWVTDATRYILITVPTAERHDGKYNTAKYRLEVTGATGFAISEHYVRIDGIQMYTTGNYMGLSINPNGAAGDIRISNSILRGTSNMASKAPLILSGTAYASATAKAWNNVIYTTGATWGVRVETDTTLYLYNNTIAGNAQGISRTTGTVVMVNNLFTANTITGGGTTVLQAGTDYNRTSNTSLGYTVTGGGNTHDAVSQTFTFVDAANSDWHLAVSDAGAKDLGVADPGSGLFSTDIDGQTRSGSWDVGMDEYPSSARRRNAVVAGMEPVRVMTCGDEIRAVVVGTPEGFRVGAPVTASGTIDVAEWQRIHPLPNTPAIWRCP